MTLWLRFTRHIFNLSEQKQHKTQQWHHNQQLSKNIHMTRPKQIGQNDPKCVTHKKKWKEKHEIRTKIHHIITICSRSWSKKDRERNKRRVFGHDFSWRRSIFGFLRARQRELERERTVAAFGSRQTRKKNHTAKRSRNSNNIQQVEATTKSKRGANQQSQQGTPPPPNPNTSSNNNAAATAATTTMFQLQKAASITRDSF